MAKSLKEALLEQMATLQERGLAPGELPPEPEEEPSYSHYEEEFTRSGGGDRDFDGRRGGRGAKGAGRVRTRQPMPRREREVREPRTRERRERDSRDQRGLPSDLVGAPPPPSRPMRPMGSPRPMAPGGPMRQGPGGPGGFGGPGGPGGPRPPASRSDMLRRNAERIQREQADRGEIQQLLAQYAGAEQDDAATEKFFQELGVETGALPPLHVVLEALKNAGNAKPAEVADQVRQYYRRPRARAVAAPVAVG